MSETRYIISDAAKLISVEPHVLRYWEEELAMEIPRNEMGHRYYTDKEVRLFTQVRDLKEKGFQLKAIKMILATLSEDMPVNNIISLDKVRKNHEDEEAKEMEAESLSLEPEPVKAVLSEPEPTAQVAKTTPEEPLSAADKMKHFRYIMDDIVMHALKKNNVLIEEQVTGKVIKEMDYLFRMQEEKEEERFRNLDASIRRKQRGRKEAAAAKVPEYPKHKSRRIFGKKDPF